MSRIFTYYEIDVPICSLNCGNGACDATPQQGLECHNTPSTCLCLECFSKEYRTYRVCVDQANIPAELDIMPFIETDRDHSYQPAQAEIGSIGSRSTAKITLTDLIYPDDADDPYFATRLTPASGTYLGRFRARHKFLPNQSMRRISGEITEPFSLANFTTQHFIITDVSVSNKNGAMTINAADILTLTNDEKTQIPAPTTAKLTSALSETELSGFTMSGDVSPYPETDGIIAFGSELVAYQQRVDEVFSTLTREIGGSQAAQHSVDTTGQNVWFVNRAHVIEFIRDILLKCKNIESEHIPFSEWQAEADFWLTDNTAFCYLFKPQSARKWLTIICEENGIFLWTDTETNTIKLKVFAPEPNTTTKLILDQDIIDGDVKIKYIDRLRINHIDWCYDPIDVTKKIERQNCTRFDSMDDVEAKHELQYGDERNYSINSAFVPGDNQYQLETTAARLLRQRRDAPIEAEFRVTYDNAMAISDVFILEVDSIQAADGTAAETRMMVTSVENLGEGSLRIKSISSGFAPNPAFWAPDDAAADYDSATEEQKESYAFWGDDNSNFSDDRERNTWV